MTKSLLARKQALVRDAIYDAAIDLFARNGFQQTTVDEIAQHAGVSRRSFFRYFATKDDVLGYTIVGHGDALIAGIAACPAGLSPFETVRETALAGVQFAISQPRTRKIIDIVTRNFSARQAQQSGLVEAQRNLAVAFAARTRSTTREALEPRMLAMLTLMLVDLILGSWYTGESKDWTTASKQVFALLSRVVCEPSREANSAKKQGTERKRSTATGVRRLPPQ